MTQAKVAVVQAGNPAWRNPRVGTLRWQPEAGSNQLVFEDGPKHGFALDTNAIRRITRADEDIVLHTSTGTYHIRFADVADATEVAIGIEAALG